MNLVFLLTPFSLYDVSFLLEGRQSKMAEVSKRDMSFLDKDSDVIFLSRLALDLKILEWSSSDKH